MFNQVINAESVKRETLDGTEYVVAPITLLKPMNLNVPSDWGVNEAYLPEAQAKDSIPSWNGTPLTLNHPSTANGNGTTANSPEIHEKSVLGRVFNTGWDDGTVDAEAWFNEQKINNMGGLAKDALEKVLSGESVEVSTGYRASKLPSGEYDGESRNAVQGNLKPDHVAVLPNATGKCSLKAGCGVGETVANSLIVTNVEMVSNQRDTARTPSFDGTETTSWADVSKDLSDWVDALGLEDISSVEDMGESQREDVASHTLLGDTDADTWGGLRFFPVVNPNTQNLNRGALVSILSGRGASADIPDSVLESAREEARSLLEDEFEEEIENSKLRDVYNTLKSVFESNGDESAESDATENSTMNEKTQELVDNHGFKAENLPDEDTDCFSAIYNRFVGESTENENETGETEEAETAENVKEITEAELEEIVNSRVDNRIEERQAQSEKEDIAEDIAGNSEEYEDAESVLEDYPTIAALNTKKSDVLGAQPDFSNGFGASAQPAQNTDDAEEITMFGGDA